MTENKRYDVVILGTGPAGLQAAIHAARRKVSVLVLGKESRSSIFHHHVENYCCVFNTTGEDIIKTGREQAAAFGAEFLDEDVLAITAEGGRFNIALESGGIVGAGAVIIATGTARKRLGVPGEKELLGRGVSYCVECDCNFYKGAEVAVVGNGSAAASGALTLLAYARTVHLVCEALDVSPALASELRQSAVALHENRKVKEITGKDGVAGVVMDDGSRPGGAGGLHRARRQRGDGACRPARRAAGRRNEAHPDEQEDGDQCARHLRGRGHHRPALAGGQGRGRRLCGRSGSRGLR